MERLSVVNGKIAIRIRSNFFLFNKSFTECLLENRNVYRTLVVSLPWYFAKIYTTFWHFLVLVLSSEVE